MKLSVDKFVSLLLLIYLGKEMKVGELQNETATHGLPRVE